MRVPSATAVGLVAALAASGGWEARARAASASPTFEATVSGGWRTSIDGSSRAPGFQAETGGGELFVGVAWGWVGLAAGGRGRGGLAGGRASGVSFVEAGADLALQLLLGERIRVRLGGEGGRTWLGGQTAWFGGGFLEGSFDVAQLGGGRAAVIFNLRVDLDSYVLDASATDPAAFPTLSTGVAAGFGMRY